VALKGVPYIVTHDGRTIRYPDPLVKVNDTVMVDIATDGRRTPSDGNTSHDPLGQVS
jgi:hypothetical protein